MCAQCRHHQSSVRPLSDVSPPLCLVHPLTVHVYMLDILQGIEYKSGLQELVGPTPGKINFGPL